MKYPFEIASFIRKTKTFAVDAKFTKSENEKPLKVFDNTFSRFVLAIIQDGEAATCNVPIEQIAYMYAATTLAFHQQMTVANTPGGSSPAFTERFVTGNLKGKSPAEVLAENGNNAKKILNEQYKWLQSNLEKYPANQKLMDAIMDASKLDMESLNTAGPAAAPIKILDIDCRPLVRKEREDGKCFCYEGHVMWNPAQKYPVSVEIKNYYAPVKKNEDGTLNVSIKEKDMETEKNHSFNMSAQEWMHVMAQMKLTKESFVMVNFAKAYKLAEDADEENRKGVHTKKENTRCKRMRRHT